MRYILAAIGVIAAFILIIVLIVALRPNGNGSGTRTTTAVPKLADLAGTDSVVRLVADGPIIAEENHRSIRIVIDENKRAIDVLQGYEGTVIGTETFDNNKESFTAFLAALDRAGYTIDRRTKLDSEAGLCPSGSRYSYELYNTPNGADFKPFRRWSISCNSAQGSFGGSAGVIRQLFTKQIPNYTEFISQTPKANTVSM